MSDHHRVGFMIDAAADNILIETDYAGGSETDRVQGAYSMAVELIAAMCDIDAEPAKARLDHRIADLLTRTWNERLGFLDDPIPGTALDADSVQAAGLDPTLRFT